LAERYLFAVVPIALGHGMAVAVSVASAMAFNYFFLSPRHSLNTRGIGAMASACGVPGGVTGRQPSGSALAA
jgi:K+-sensing histidine kinase KdpD